MAILQLASVDGSGVPLSDGTKTRLFPLISFIFLAKKGRQGSTYCLDLKPYTLNSLVCGCAVCTITTLLYIVSYCVVEVPILLR
jgi:hypothetical protein